VNQPVFHRILFSLLVMTANGWSQDSLLVVTSTDSSFIITDLLAVDLESTRDSVILPTDDSEISPVAQSAFSLRLSGQAQPAKDMLEVELQKNQRDNDCLYEAARTYFYLFQFDSAESKVDQLLARKPENPKYYELGALLAIYHAMDQMRRLSDWVYVPFTFRRSLRLYEKLLTIDPTDDAARILLIKSYHRLPWIFGGVLPHG